MKDHVLSITDLNPSDVVNILDSAEASSLAPVMREKGAALIFEHPSLRTRNAAEMAVFSLGGHPLSIRGDEIGLDTRESTEDVARTLGCYHSVIGARVASHQTLERMAAALDDAGVDVPIINLLSDVEHPTQALADLLTIRQNFGTLARRTVAFIGDANNVARSLALGCAMVGASVRVAAPPGFSFSEDDLAHIRAIGGDIVQTLDPIEAATGADVLYSDVWISMGEEGKAPTKHSAFSGFTIGEDLLRLANSEAIVMHCLPAHRGEEVTAEVIDGPRSRIWQQAENRVHAMRGLLFHVMSKRIDR